MIYIYKPSNYLSTSHYIDIILTAFRNLDDNIIIISSEAFIKPSSKNDVVFAATLQEAVNLLLNGYSNLIYWCQGVAPEEKLMTKGSRYKVLLLTLAEKIVLKNAKAVFLVSDFMKEHYEQKYRIDFKNRSYIMPCFKEDTLNIEDILNNEIKYKENKFLYSGSLLVWQCFEETLRLYSMIENKIDRNSSFKVLTKDTEKASKIIDRYNIKNYSIKYIADNTLSEEIKEYKYGFVLRDDNIVNHVATPTKISTYLSEGIIPIMTRSLTDFYVRAKDMENIIWLDSINDIERNISIIAQHMRREVEKNRLVDEYEYIFENYYNTNKNIKNITGFLRDII